MSKEFSKISDTDLKLVETKPIEEKFHIPLLKRRKLVLEAELTKINEVLLNAKNLNIDEGVKPAAKAIPPTRKVESSSLVSDPAQGNLYRNLIIGGSIATALAYGVYKIL